MGGTERGRGNHAAELLTCWPDGVSEGKAGRGYRGFVGWRSRAVIGAKWQAPRPAGLNSFGADRVRWVVLFFSICMMGRSCRERRITWKGYEVLPPSLEGLRSCS